MYNVYKLPENNQTPKKKKKIRKKKLLQINLDKHEGFLLDRQKECQMLLVSVILLAIVYSLAQIPDFNPGIHDEFI